ncbi:MAG: alpha/beta hydrolase, partial [Candidatus Hydrogenedentales bacterium]
MILNRFARVLTAVVVLTAAASGFAQNNDKPFEQFQDMVYGDVHGTGLMMDVFVPTGEKNGLAIVDIASGAFHSDRGKIRDHESARFYHIFTNHGYTIFAIRPGSVTKYTAEEMVQHIKRGIRWVKAHAEEYGIDPERVGLVGASAGGHLATLTAVQPEPGRPDADDPLQQHNTDVAADGVFIPPTNFILWREEPP